jgi:predicted kinase
MSKLKLIIISGLPGSGKSTLAEAVAQKLKLPIFSVDPIESSIIKSGIKKSFETGLAAYLIAETLAFEHLKLGTSVIIDAVSPVKESREMWHGLSKKFDTQLIIIECVLNHEIHKKRIESRIRNMHGIPEVTWDDVENRHKEYLPWNEERLIVDSANGVEENLDKVVEYINRNID